MQCPEDRKAAGLPESLIDRIKAEVRQAAVDHLNAKDARTALDHFTENVIAVSNTTLFTSFESLSEDVKAYYDILKNVDSAAWDEMYIDVINENTALVTATFRYSFTDIDDRRTDLKGVWTALYVRRGGRWNIRMRHESFAPRGND